MKKILFLITLLNTYLLVFSQNLTIHEILKFKNMNLSQIEEYVSLKGWEFSSSNEETESSLSYVTFTYQKSYTSNNAVSFLNCIKSNTENVTRILIQVNNIKKYNEYINTIKSFGCKLVDSSVGKNEIIKIYKGKTTTFKITSTTSENDFDSDVTIWNFFITSNLDYLINFENVYNYNNFVDPLVIDTL